MYHQGAEQSSLPFDIFGKGDLQIEKKKGGRKKKQYLLFLVNKDNGTQMCHMPVQTVI